MDPMGALMYSMRTDQACYLLASFDLGVESQQELTSQTKNAAYCNHSAHRPTLSS